MISIIGTVCLTLYSVLVKNKAMREVVQGVQNIRYELDDADKDTITKNRIDNYLGFSQSKTTKDIVKKIKAVL